MKPEQNPYSAYTLAVNVMGQVGCLLVFTILGLAVVGFLLDQLLGTKPIFLLVFLLGSIPLNILFILWYARRKAKNLQNSSSPKEDTISD